MHCGESRTCWELRLGFWNKLLKRNSGMITVNSGKEHWDVKTFRFPAGELQTQIINFPNEINEDVIIFANVQSTDHLVELMLVNEIVDRTQYGGKKVLKLPYFPYGRQDRVMASNEAFSLKVVAQLINSMKFDRVITCDPHSDVLPALVDNIKVVSQLDIIKKFWRLNEIISQIPMTIICPDAGAYKKAYKVAAWYGQPLVVASKVRDLKDGSITDTHIQDRIYHKEVLIVDDICDGGKTFIELGKALRWEGVEKVYLYVTHGIFSKGFDVFDGIIDHIYTTNSYLWQPTMSGWPGVSDKLTVLNIEDII